MGIAFQRFLSGKFTHQLANLNQRKNLMDDYDVKIAKAKSEISDLKKSVDKASDSRDNQEGQRDKLLEEMNSLQEKKTKLESEIKNYERSDPKIIVKMEEDSKVARDAANRWTDNCFIILQWIQNSKPGFTQKDIEKNFPIFKELDYIEA